MLDRVYLAFCLTCLFWGYSRESLAFEVSIDRSVVVAFRPGLFVTAAVVAVVVVVAVDRRFLNR